MATDEDSLPPSSMRNELHNHFVPQVQEKLRKANLNVIPKIELKFVEHMARVDGMRYNLSVTFDQPIACMDLIEVAQALDAYCTADDGPYAAADGRHYMIGDGDDSGAVMFEDGKFSIWVRGWPEGGW